MIYINSLLNVIDNSGAKKVKCLKIYGKSAKSQGLVGDLILVVIKKALPNKAIKKGDLYKAVICRSSVITNRFSGSKIKCDYSCVVLLNDRLLPVGSRVLSGVFLELAKKPLFSRILTLAPKIV